VSESARYRADDLRKFCCAALQALEVPPFDAEEVSECLVAADLHGVDSHGVVRLPVYAGRIRQGAVNPRPTTHVVQQRGNTPLFDGDNGLGPVVGARAMEKAIAVAELAGIGVAGVRRSNNRILGIPLVPSIVEQLAEPGESLGLAFPSAADSTGLAETPA
jgi:LDH2 family malate/lactate/ureidoglycolate dehydrogenase